MHPLKLIVLFFSSLSASAADLQDIELFNETYSQIVELKKQARIQEAAELGLDSIGLAERVYVADTKNLANFYSQVTNLNLAQGFYKRSSESVVSLAKRSLALNGQYYGSQSSESIRASTLLLKTIARIDLRGKDLEDLDFIIRDYKSVAGRTIRDTKNIVSEELAEFYLLLSASQFYTPKALKNYSRRAAEQYEEILGKSHHKTMSARLAATRFGSNKSQLKDLISLIPLFGSDEASRRLKAAGHLKISTLYLLLDKDEDSLIHNKLAFQIFQELGDEMNPVNGSDYVPVLKANPVYPRRALARKIEGYVILEYTVSKSGSIKDPKILESQPASIFDASALKAASEYKYLPRIVNGEPIDVKGVKTRITFDFFE
jgi:TonB family protein